MKAIGCVLIMAALGLASASFPETTPRTDERLGFYKWFDGAGFPEVSFGRFVKVSVGTKTLYCFEKSGTKREVTSLDLTTDALDHPTTALFRGAKATVTPIDFRVWVKGIVSSLDAGAKYLDWSVESWMAESFESLMVLSRACSARDMDGEAYDLFERCQKTMGAYRQKDPNPLLTAFQASFWRNWIDRTMEDFSHPEVPRTLLLQRFQWLKRECPSIRDGLMDGKSFPEYAIPILEREVIEDQKPVASKTESVVGIRVANLIHQLRDQTPDDILKHSTQLRYPYEHDAYLSAPQVNERGFIPDSKKSKPGDADAELVELGYRAVPQLLDALSDESFTRAYRGDNYMVSKEVFQVRDAALGILKRISHIEFWPAEEMTLILGIGPIENDRDYDRHWKQAIASARSWWEGVERSGDRQTMIDIVSEGDESSVGLAKFLIEKHPADAFNAITKAIKADEFYPSLQATYIDLLSSLRSEQTEEFVRTLTLESKYGDPVAACARVLAVYDPRAAEAGLSAYWHKFSGEWKDSIDVYGITAFVNSLMALRSVNGIDAVSDHFGPKSVGVRQVVLEALTRSLSRGSLPRSSTIRVRRYRLGSWFTVNR